MKPSYNLENKTSSDTYWRVKLVCKKVQAHSSWEPPLEYNQGQPDVFGKSKFIMAFLTILGLTEILCSFRWVREGKICKDTWVIKIKVLRTVFSKQFCFIRCRRQNLRWYSRFTFVGNSPKVPRAKFQRSDWLFYFIIVWKIGIFKNPFATITSLSELYFRFGRFNLLVQTKKVISVYYANSTSSRKPWRWMRLDLIFLWRIYTSI